MNSLLLFYSCVGMSHLLRIIYCRAQNTNTVHTKETDMWRLPLYIWEGYCTTILWIWSYRLIGYPACNAQLSPAGTAVLSEQPPQKPRMKKNKQEILKNDWLDMCACVRTNTLKHAYLSLNAKIPRLDWLHRERRKPLERQHPITQTQHSTVGNI